MKQARLTADKELKDIIIKNSLSWSDKEHLFQKQAKDKAKQAKIKDFGRVE